MKRVQKGPRLLLTGIAYYHVDRTYTQAYAVRSLVRAMYYSLQHISTFYHCIRKDEHVHT
jgi:hypothetical protein